MCFDNFFYDRKAEPGAAFVPATGEVCLVETLPDFGDAVFRNTHTIVFDGNIGSVSYTHLDVYKRQR